MRTKILLAGLAIVLAGALGMGIAQARGIHAGSVVSVARGQTVDKTYYAAAQTVDIAGTVNGDLICAGQDVSITGTVAGDVICAGLSVNISGTVIGDVRVAGQNITIDGTVQGSLSAAGQTITLESGAKIARDASIAGQTADVNGSIARDLWAGSQNIAVNGTIGRNVQAANQTLSLGNGARIGGDLTYTSLNLLSRASGATVAGNITRHTPPHKDQNAVRLGAFIRGGLVFALYMFAALLATALVLVLLIPHVFHAATEAAIGRPWQTLLVGFVASIVAPAVVFLLMVTVIGIPLGILALLLWLVVMSLAAPFAAYYLGRVLLGRSETNALLIMLLGASILLVCYFIPFVGVLITLLATWFGVGVIVLQVRQLLKPQYAVGNPGSPSGRK